jgi:DNA-binding GntR family transcriptional regulator
MILGLEVDPGAQLLVDDLAQGMGTSRTPVREAILRLEKDGLVRVVPRVGIFVTEITRRDLEELYELREILESRAIEDAAVHLSDDDLAHLDRLLDHGRAAVAANDLDGFLQSEIGFHSFLLQRSGNRRLVSVVESFQDLTYRWRVLSVRARESLADTLSEHARIAEALHRRDPDLAGKMMREHIQLAKERISHVVEEPKAELSTSG